MKTNGFKKEFFLSSAVALMAIIAAMMISASTLYAGDDNKKGGFYGQEQYGDGAMGYGGGEDDDDDNNGGSKGKGDKTFSNTGFQPIYPLYQTECGACHFAYQPGFLTQRSWKHVMTTLDKHFGTDASLDESDAPLISDYLAKFAADSGNTYYKYYQKLNRSVAPNEAPMRISELPYFIKEHRKVPVRIIEQPEVRSFSHCQKCHITADRGIYSERDIMIPGYGRWDD